MTRNRKTVRLHETPAPVRSDFSREGVSGFPLEAAWRWRILCGVLLLAAVLASRLPLAPRYLITFDEINFALSIENFNSSLHQPQPPSYPLFVGMLKLLSFFIPKVETVFMAAALLLSMASLVLLRVLGEQTLGQRWGRWPQYCFCAIPHFGIRR